MDDLDSIVMINLDALHHHPDNPRKDMGDLTELAESIRKNGVMQNLTVIQGHWRSKEEFADDCRKEGVAKDSAMGMYDRDNSWTRTGFTVVIGNRRMEAAKLAGLEAVPCVIVGMDYKTQISTMLEENMQRTDLTVYEQAQGFQMMMDLGLTEAEISDMTGFSRTTVKRRVKMAELDQETLQKVGAQLTMDDLDQLAKIRDLDKRNELLKEAGTSNFKWKIENAATEQKKEDNYQQIRAILLQAGCIEKSTDGMHDFWKTNEYLPYESRINLEKYEAGQNVLPEDPAGERQLYFYKEWGCVRFWAEKQPAEEQEEEEPTEEQIEKQKKLDEAQAAWTKLEEIEKHAQESRDSFIADLELKQKDSRKALEWMIQAMTVTNNAETCMDRVLPDPSDEELEQLPDGHTEADIALDYIRTGIAEAPTLYAEVMGALFFDGEDCIWMRWRRDDKPKYCRNLAMITGYEWLEAFGYQVSDDERAYLDGTLDCYNEEAEDE